VTLLSAHDQKDLANLQVKSMINRIFANEDLGELPPLYYGLEVLPSTNVSLLLPFWVTGRGYGEEEYQDYFQYNQKCQ